MSHDITPFEAIRRTNPAGNEYWSSRDFARVLGYVNYRHLSPITSKCTTCDHFKVHHLGRVVF